MVAPAFQEKDGRVCPSGLLAELMCLKSSLLDGKVGEPIKTQIRSLSRSPHTAP